MPQSVTPPPPPANVAPVIAATNQAVKEGEITTLSASVSDSDGSISEYSWVQTEGQSVEFEIIDNTSIRFVAPEVVDTEELVFRLTVIDDDDARSSTLITAEVSFNQPPEVNVEAVSYVEQTDVQLVAQVNDDDGGVAGVVWEQISGPTLLNMQPDANTLAFTTPAIEAQTTVEMKVTVTDGFGKTSELQFTLTLELFFYEFAVTGAVPDTLTQGDKVSLSVGGKTFETTVDENREYQVSLELDKSSSEQVVSLTASAADSTNKAAYRSILGSVQQLYAAGGEEALIDASKSHLVNLDHFTTAISVALFQVNNELPVQESDLEAAYQKINYGSIVDLATAQLLMLDYAMDEPTYAVPSEVETTLALLDDSVAFEKYWRESLAFDPGMYWQISSNLFQGVKTSAVSLSVDDFTGYHFEYNDSRLRGGRLTFDEDRSATFVDEKGESKLTWENTGSGLILTTMAEQDLGVFFDCEFIEPSINIGFCDYYRIGLSLSSYKLLPDVDWWILTSTNRVEINHPDASHGPFENREHLISRKFKADELTPTVTQLEFGHEYVIPIGDFERSVDANLLDSFTESLRALKLRFFEGSQIGGPVEYDYPKPNINGEVNMQTVEGVWTASDDGSIRVQFFNTVAMSTSIQFLFEIPERIEFSAVTETDDSLFQRSWGGYKRDESAQTRLESNLSGIYSSSPRPLEPLNYFWIELNEDGTALTVSTDDDNLDGQLESSEVRQMPGFWIINERGHIAIRRYAHSANGNLFIGDYCRPARFEFTEGDTCVVYNEREWDVFTYDEGENPSVGVFQMYHFMNTNHDLTNYDGTNKLDFEVQSNITYQKLSNRPIELPEE